MVIVLLMFIFPALLYKFDTERFLDNPIINILIAVGIVPLFVQISLFFINSALKTTKAIIFYAPRETFWQRNRDNIFAGAIGAVITACLAIGISVFNNKTSSAENDPVIQQQEN